MNKSFRRGTFAAVLAAAASMLSVASAQHGGHDYATTDVGRVQTIQTGRVIERRVVRLHEQPGFNYSLRPSIDSADACALLGGSLGAIGASRVGRGTGQVAAGLGGAALGAYLGKAACSRPKQGVEFVVEMDAGRVIALVQEDDSDIQIGDRVRLVEGARTRLARIAR